MCRALDGEQNMFLAKWCRKYMAVSRNPNGLTGWASVDANAASVRIHICAHDPCPARYPASKYGTLPVPLHCRFVPGVPPAADKESALVLDLVPPAPPPPLQLEQAPALLSDVLQDGELSDMDIDSKSSGGDANCLAMSVSMSDASAEDAASEDDAATYVAPADELLPPVPSPAEADLRSALPAAPISGTEGCQPQLAAALPQAAEAVASASTAAVAGLQPVDEDTPLGMVLRLARSIRRPRTYGGYAMFVVFALMK